MFKRPPPKPWVLTAFRGGALVTSPLMPRRLRVFRWPCSQDASRPPGVAHLCCPPPAPCRPATVTCLKASSSPQWFNPEEAGKRYRPQGVQTKIAATCRGLVINMCPQKTFCHTQVLHHWPCQVLGCSRAQLWCSFWFKMAQRPLTLGPS